MNIVSEGRREMKATIIRVSIAFTIAFAISLVKKPSANKETKFKSEIQLKTSRQRFVNSLINKGLINKN